VHTLIVIGIALVAAVGAYLATIGLFLVPSEHAPAWRHRRKGLGNLYLIAGIAPVALGLFLVLGTAFDETDANDEPLDSSFAGGMVSTLDDSVWYLFGGWLTLGGAVIATGAVCGRRGWPLAKSLLALGLLLIGVPALLFGVGLIYLLLIPTLVFWRQEPDRATPSP
jgi:ABC-type Fe3+ transport system permease subunit